MVNMNGNSSPHQPAGMYPLSAESLDRGYWNGQSWDPRPLASVGMRIVAWLVDLLVVVAIWIVLTAIVAIIGAPGGGSLPNSIGVLIVFILPAVSFIAYFTIFYATTGRTLGMLLSGMYLVEISSANDRLTWARALIRAAVLLVGAYFLVTAIIWLALTAGNKNRQGPQDLAAGSVVLRKPKILASPPPVIPSNTSQDASPELLPAPVAETAEQETLVEVKNDQPVIFISHASEDAPIAAALGDELELQGFRTWRATRDVGIGTNYAAEIVRAVSNAQYLLVLLSPASIDSPHVRREVSIAIDRNVQILPVSTDPTGEFMTNLPVDWTYWLSLAQVFRMSDAASTAAEIARRMG